MIERAPGLPAGLVHGFSDHEARIARALEPYDIMFIEDPLPAVLPDIVLAPLLAFDGRGGLYTVDLARFDPQVTYYEYAAIVRHLTGCVLP